MPRNLFFLSTPLHPSPPFSTFHHPSPLLPIPQPTNLEDLLQQQVAQLGAAQPCLPTPPHPQPTNFEELLQQQVAQLGAAQLCLCTPLHRSPSFTTPSHPPAHQLRGALAAAGGAARGGSAMPGEPPHSGGVPANHSGGL
ncbi:unnamed protein product [Closterium sp. NIES-53]